MDLFGTADFLLLHSDRHNFHNGLSVLAPYVAQKAIWLSTRRVFGGTQKGADYILP